MIVTRFAPSPTGKLHLGHAYSALLAHSLAREAGGRFLLRFEDIDHTRVRPDYYQGILEDLSWLGLTWDAEVWKQSDRLDHYQDALDQLKKLDVVYPCYCTRREIEEELSQLTHAPHGPEGALYPGTCRGRSTPLDDREPAWRLDSARAAQLTGPLSFYQNPSSQDDRSKKEKISVKAELLGDIILARKDIGTSYHLAVVVDDAAQEITHITRGADLLPSTHLHRTLQSLLNFPQATYHHHQLICNDQGQRLAKRHDSLALSTLRERGKSPRDLREILTHMIKK